MKSIILLTYVYCAAGRHICRITKHMENSFLIKADLSYLIKVTCHPEHNFIVNANTENANTENLSYIFL